MAKQKNWLSSSKITFFDAEEKKKKEKRGKHFRTEVTK